ncbi:PucR family transcriptional regulator ligand-binding domain-containing protein [Bacillus shivajii]|uniref:PucR family transcriptional regulator ligand-binding domain-containing protein n=1 Tax=Bacillus shivajii TaxID=1983719 RepID=UPI001CFA5EF6|nr:PucR family transcriptional regulator ligand-binding domain-containing protein [Bacillus shivajii]UCZ54878.1 PucR family transcriptional regulator ligand-binding domain-containing protein [Bacillus shivajii]
MLTIREALKLPVLKGTKLIAGNDGVNRSIKWVTTIEIIEDISRFQAGEFIVTTGFGLEKDDHLKNCFLQLIRENSLAGIAIYKGFYLDNVPASFISEANKQQLPLIEIPPSINFSTITKGIVEQIGNQQMRLLEESLSVHKEMTKLALNNDGLDEILNKLSPLTDSSLFVFDDLGQLISSKNLHSASLLVNDKEIVVDNDSRKINDLFHDSENRKNVYTFKWNSFYCFRSPIHAESFTYGYLVAFHHQHKWSEMDEIIMDHVSTLIGIELVKQYAIEETKVRLRGELVEEILMKDNLNTSAAIKRGKKLGYNLTIPHQAIFIKVSHDQQAYTDKKDWSNHLHYIVLQSFANANRQHILLPKLDSLFALIEAEDSSDKTNDMYDCLLNIQERWHNHFDEPLKIGVGRLYHSVQQLSLSAKEAEYAVQYSPLLLKESLITHYDELGFYQMLIQMQESGISLQQFYETHLKGLIDQKNDRPDLIQTLETYLMYNCHIQKTASHLYIHRHTLKYRLAQIEKKAGVNLQSPRDRMNLHLAIFAYKFVQLHQRIS